MTSYRQAPELTVSQWLNAHTPITLEQLRGRVVVLHAFQMLCPGCVLHGIPQAERIRETFSQEDVAVLGLHTVFEHHAAMNADALRAFVQEYRISIPVGIDVASADGPIPITMQALQLRGTPSLVLIDRAGAIRYHHFGRIDDMRIGAEIAGLVGESLEQPEAGFETQQGESRCTEEYCAIGEKGGA